MHFNRRSTREVPWSISGCAEAVRKVAHSNLRRCPPTWDLGSHHRKGQQSRLPCLSPWDSLESRASISGTCCTPRIAVDYDVEDNQRHHGCEIRLGGGVMAGDAAFTQEKSLFYQRSATICTAPIVIFWCGSWSCMSQSWNTRNEDGRGLTSLIATARTMTSSRSVH